MKRVAYLVSMVMVGVGLALLFGVRVVGAVRARASSQVNAAAPATVAVTPVSRRDLDERVTFTGVVRPRNEVDLLARIPGRIEKVWVEVGQAVRAGQALALVEHTDVALQKRQAEAQKQAARVALEQARRNHERYQKLRQEGAIAQAELEQVEDGVRSAEAQHALADAALGLADHALRNTQITSPIAGTLTRRWVNVGTQASPMQPAFQVQDVSTLKLEGSVSGADFARLSVGQKAEVTVDQLPGAVFHGVVATLSPTLDPRTRRAEVAVAIASAEGQLLPNMLAQARVTVESRPAVLAIPTGAIVPLPSGKVFFLVREGRAVVVPADGLDGAGEYLAAGSGVADGDQIVVAGQAGLTDGAQVAVATVAKESKR